MKYCKMCGCHMDDKHEADICECCLDDIYESDPGEEVIYESIYKRGDNRY